MSYLDLKIGYACDNNCVHCVIANQRILAKEKRGNTERTTQECFNEIDDSISKGVSSVVVTGGEPTIRGDFLELVQYAKAKGLIVCLQSNGREFRSMEFTQSAAPFIDYYTIALHGSSECVHDKITVSKSSFFETLEGLKNIVRVSPNVTIKTVISTINYKDLPNLIRLIDGLGIHSANFAFPHANGNAARNFSRVVPYYKDIRPYIEECIELSEQIGFHLELEQILPCLFDRVYDLKYFADLKYQTNMVELKQLNEDTMDWVKERKKMKRKNEICSQCFYDGICEGYWMEYIQTRGFSEFHAVQEAPSLSMR